jgi:hypothetical protein
MTLTQQPLQRFETLKEVLGFFDKLAKFKEWKPKDANWVKNVKKQMSVNAEPQYLDALIDRKINPANFQTVLQSMRMAMKNTMEPTKKGKTPQSSLELRWFEKAWLKHWEESVSQPTSQHFKAIPALALLEMHLEKRQREEMLAETTGRIRRKLADVLQSLGDQVEDGNSLKQEWVFADGIVTWEVPEQRVIQKGHLEAHAAYIRHCDEIIRLMTTIEQSPLSWTDDNAVGDNRRLYPPLVPVFAELATVSCVRYTYVYVICFNICYIV